ncbi:MAG: hypothetical protein K2W95_14395 [Candidatus Obscuribacterales bacterium]|nr:hypothetical protein [Candidatus Obscuribacterales bacterium]
MKSTTKLDLQRDVQYFEYTKAANPVASGVISGVPFAELLSHLHEQGPTRVIQFDLSDKLVCPGPATSPNLAAAFVRIEAGKQIRTTVNATSELFYVMRGNGTTTRTDLSMHWKQGDFFVIPGGDGPAELTHEAATDSALYWINDEPLLRYLGVTATSQRFLPTLYKAEDCERELMKIAADPSSTDRNRVAVLLANKNFPQTMTATHTLWAMFGLLPKGAVQQPHRHNSVALDLILDCKPGCYSLVSREMGPDGVLINPVRQDWKPYSAFVTPPNFWHSHHNESGEDARLIPIQDAGLQTYMRTLNIEFAHPSARRKEG